MASCSSLLREEQFQCSICLEVFTEPVSIACGHNFCKACIAGYWDNSNHYQCPLCKETFTRRPELKTNTTIRELSDHFKGMRERSLDEPAAEHGDEACDICTWSKLKAAKFCLECLTSFCEIHLEPHHRVAGLKRHTLLDPEVKLQNRMCKKHNVLLDMFCRTDKECVCQLCISEDHETHNTVPLEVEWDEIKTRLGETELRVRQMIQEKLQKVQEVKHLVGLSKRDAERDISDSVQVFTALVASIERSQSELIWVIKKRQREIERRAKGFVKALEQDISALQRRCTEVEQLSHTNDLRVLLGSSSLSSLPHMNVRQEFSLQSSQYEQNVRKSLRSTISELEETARRELSDFEEKFNKEMEMFPEQKLKRILHYAVDVTLDPDTAHRSLTLSDDGKVVREGKWQKRPFNTKRFTGLLGSSVVAKEGFLSGRFYFEVQVEGKKKWAIGVVRESVDRKRWFPISTEHGYWTIELGDGYKANTAPSVFLYPRKLKKVGVFVDYDEGQVSFYDTESKSHIFSFTGYTFTEKLYPYFYCGIDDSAPLVVIPVNLEDEDF